MALSTAILIHKNYIKKKWFAEEFKINTKTLKSSVPKGELCSDERFRDQISAGACSGFLVAADLMVTAGHCMNKEQCSSYKWVFDFNSKQLEKDNSVPLGSVYSCKSVVEFKNASTLDYALVQLDRPMTDRLPLNIRREGKIKDNASLVVIGNPSGIPTKVAAGANVRINSSENSFKANLDSFIGNSGSAVFNADSGVIEGVLTGGEVIISSTLNESVPK